MKMITRQFLPLLFLSLTAFTLTACNGQVIEKPVMVAPPPIAEPLVTCTAMPPHPCPLEKTETAGPVAPVVSHETYWSKFVGRFNPIAPETLDNIKAETKPAPPRICTEKQRLRWEAMMMQWGKDCESKLKSVRGLINKPQ